MRDALRWLVGAALMLLGGAVVYFVIQYVKGR